MFCYDIVKLSCFNCYTFLCKRHINSLVSTDGYIRDFFGIYIFKLNQSGI